MKTLLLILSFFFIGTDTFAQSEVLTNQSVLDMIDLGFSEDVIVAKIETSDSDFDATIKALKNLKEMGVSDTIIMAIINKTKSGTENVDVEGSRNEDGYNVGLYTNDSGDLRKILPTVFSGSKMNTLGTALSYGLASTNISSVLNNPTSANIINTCNPEFIFFFGRPSNQQNFNNGANWWFFTATSPNEFVLVKLDKKGKRRELQTGSVNIFAGTSIGIDENSIIPFEIISVDNYTFKVVAVDPLQPGEYCFLYRGTVPQGGYTNQAVFDFSIQAQEAPSKFYVGNTVWILYKGKPKRCDVSEIARKKDDIYYTLFPHFSGKVVVCPESKCFSSKQELIESLDDEIIE